MTRNAKIRSLYSQGWSLRWLSTRFGISFERARQIVAKEDRNALLRTACAMRMAIRAGRVSDPIEGTF